MKIGGEIESEFTQRKYNKLTKNIDINRSSHMNCDDGDAATMCL